jgi:hypothetical protein
LKHTFFIFISLCFLFSQCKKSDTTPPDYSNVTTSTNFETGKSTGIVQGNYAKELSGMAASRENAGLYWVHNDGKSITDLYLLDSLGKRKGTALLTNIITQDCEDIATGKGPDATKNYIYLADTGDNLGDYATHSIYRIEEPKLPANASGNEDLTFNSIEKLSFSYPNNAKPNAETLMLDPITKDLLIVTKANNLAQVFRFPFPQSITSTTTLTLVAELDIDKATAGDISSDGKEILIKNKEKIFHWDIAANSDAINTLNAKNPQTVPYIAEIQGESLCFNFWNTGFLTTTERSTALEQAIYFYKKK